MAEAFKRESYVITLSKDEAYWLKCYLQNRMVETESQYDQENRASIWTALDMVGVGREY